MAAKETDLMGDGGRPKEWRSRSEREGKLMWLGAALPGVAVRCTIKACARRERAIPWSISGGLVLCGPR